MTSGRRVSSGAPSELAHRPQAQSEDIGGYKHTQNPSCPPPPHAHAHLSPHSRFIPTGFYTSHMLFLLSSLFLPSHLLLFLLSSLPQRRALQTCSDQRSQQPPPAPPALPPSHPSAFHMHAESVWSWEVLRGGNVRDMKCLNAPNARSRWDMGCEWVKPGHVVSLQSADVSHPPSKTPRQLMTKLVVTPKQPRLHKTSVHRSALTFLNN